MGALEKREIRQHKRVVAGMKIDKRISEYQDVVQNSPNKFSSQIAPRLKTPREGKKMFTVTKKLETKEVFDQGFPMDKEPIKLLPDASTSSLAKKSRISIDFMRSILDTNNQDKIDLIREIHKAEIDFRSLNTLRINLQAEVLSDKSMPLEVYQNHRDRIYKPDSKYHAIEPEFFKFVMEDNGKLNVIKFAEIVELYNYLPVRVTKDRNKSNEVYYQMLSNKSSSQVKKNDQEQKDPYLEKLLDILYWKITERFTKLADAFKFFDSSMDGSISFQEFKEGLERIRMKLHDLDAKRIFSALDVTGNGELSYQEFCELCEERRRNIDPFDREALNRSVVVTNMVRRQSQNEVGSIHQSTAPFDMDTLEKVIRLKPLSSTKSTNLEKRGKSNETRFGMPSTLRGVEDMNKIMCQDYLRDYLQNRLTRNAIEYQNAYSKTLNQKSPNTRSSLLRTSKNAINILQKKLVTSLEDLKYSKANQNNISFAEIDKKQIQLRKRFTLPPLLQQSPGSHILQDLKQTTTQDQSPQNSHMQLMTPSILYPKKRGSLTGSKSIGDHRSRNQQDILDEIDSRLKNFQPIGGGGAVSAKSDSHHTPTKLPSKYQYMTVGSEKLGKEERDQIVSQYFNVKKQLVETSSKYKI